MVAIRKKNLISVEGNQWAFMPLQHDDENYAYWKKRGVGYWKRIFQNHPYLLVTKSVLDYTQAKHDFIYIFQPIANHKKSYVMAFNKISDRQRLYYAFADECYAFAN